MALLHYLSRAGCLNVFKHLILGKVLALVVLLLPLRITCVFVDSIDAGFSASAMSYVDNDGVFLQSLSNSFSLSFCSPPQQLIFYLCITHVSSGVVVWTASRDSPFSQSDRLVFSRDGNAALVHGNSSSSIIWSTNTTGRGATRMQMQDLGNLVLLDAANKTVWQSFDYPTDTLLSGQALKDGMKLVSRISDINYSTGVYSLAMEAGDLRLVFLSTSIYWSMSRDVRLVISGTRTPAYANLSSSGLSLETADSAVVALFNWNNSGSLYRAQLLSTGNLDIYFYTPNIWNFQFRAPNDVCQLPLFCGNNGVCSSGQCSCPDLFPPVDRMDPSLGCQGPAAPPCTNPISSTVKLDKVGDGLDYFGNQYFQPNKTDRLESCLLLCEQDCSCHSAFYYNDTGSCFLYAEIGTVRTSSDIGRSLYMKTNESTKAPEPPQGTASSPSGLPTFVVPVIIGSSVIVIFLMIGTFMYWFLKVRRRNLSEEDYADDEIFLDSIPGLPRRFTYKELQVATRNFSSKLGTGGFGCVYEGVLADKTKVAVKQLESVSQGKKEFRAEVAIIGKIHHQHLVQLQGFCAQGAHRLLVYEFMSNSSLDKCLFTDGKNNGVLDWETRHKIALGTAQGLAYLHTECREKIIHCDIKPENILLDDNFNAKVSDFGLAKLLNKEQSQVFTMMRGTRGYLAPEWLMNLAISEKSDVYSFGMVLLELISGRKNYEPDQPSEKCYFPAYAFQRAEHGELEELVDARLKGSASIEGIKEAVRIALWCIQEETPTRPSMTKVVQMLDGAVKVPDPPLSTQFAVMLHARMVEAMTSTKHSSSSSEPTNSRGLVSAVRLSAPR